MKKLLLAATALVGLGGLAHAQSLPTQGFNAGSFAGSNAAIGVQPGQLGTPMANPGALSGLNTGSVVSTGSAYSSSTLANPNASNSYSTSTGSIVTNVTGTNAPKVTATQADEAYTSIGMTAPNFSNQTSALSQQQMGVTKAGAGTVTLGTTGQAASNVQLTDMGNQANAASNGQIGAQVNAPVAGVSVSRLDYSNSAISQNQPPVTLSTPFVSVSGAGFNTASAASGDSLASTPGMTGSLSASANGYSKSNANLGLTSTANANSQGAVTGTFGANAGFTGQQVDQTQSSISQAGGISTPGLTLGVNFNAEANAGQNIAISDRTQGAHATTLTNSIQDTNSASSQSVVNPNLGEAYAGNPPSGTATSSSLSSDSLSGGVNGAAGGNYAGTSNVNAQTNAQITGNYGSFQAGGLGGNTVISPVGQPQ